MHLLEHPLRPRGGLLQVPDRPGVELDEQKIQEERDVDV